LTVKPEWVKSSWIGLGVGGVTWQCSEEGFVPESSVAPWVIKPLEGSPDPHEDWMIYSEMANVQGAQHGEDKAKWAMPLRAKHQNEAAQMGHRPLETS
jgi:hypothetical protein